ncbi:MAG: HU family DNA-binding protein [Chitinophagales bacterium]
MKKNYFSFISFCRFSVNKRKVYTKRCPKIEAVLQILAKNIATFKADKTLEKIVSL